jgi:GNAT superfamily N-acetyltransferase
MPTFSNLDRPQQWTRSNTDGDGDLLISTDPTLIPLSQLNKAFASDFMYWATSLPEAALRELVDRSLCFGLYSYSPTVSNGTMAREEEEEEQVEERTLIGFARAITDRVTFFYLTDVYIDASWQGRGLGKWLVTCVQEVVDGMPLLRRSMCIVGVGEGEEDGEGGMERFYRRLMGMEAVRDPVRVLSRKGRGNVF